MIVAGIGSRKGVSAAEVIAAVEAALKEHGLEIGALSALATTEFKRGENGIFEAGETMGLRVIVVEVPPPLTPLLKGEGDYADASAKASETEAREPPESPSPLRGGVRGGGEGSAEDKLMPPGVARSDTSASGAPPPSIPPLKGEGGTSVAPHTKRSAPPLTCLPASSPREREEESHPRTLSLKVAGVPSVSEAAALAAAGQGARLAGPRIVVGSVTCAIAFSGDRP